MVNPFKLDWKHFLIDFIQDPGITFRRALEILGQGTSAHKAAAILRAIHNPAADYAARFPEEMELLNKLPKGQLDVVPYPLKGTPLKIDVKREAPNELAYILHDGKCLYFPDTMSEQDGETCYRSLMEGEDIFGRGRVKSPHAYQDDAHRVCPGDVVIDVGCAEGLFALDIAEIAGRLFLFEQLPRWTRPLQLTFKPYEAKTVLVNKLVADRTAGDSVRLVDAIPDDRSATYFIKMDIEGWEKTVLEASADFLRTHRVKISCCAYHRQRDEKDISEFLKSIGYEIRFSEGYMLPPLDRVEAPYFRKGMIYAQNF